jgi:hypothetical protein
MMPAVWRRPERTRLTPWRSPYLRWRIETFWGVHADSIGFGDFWRFNWQHRQDLMRFLRWAERMERL